MEETVRWHTMRDDTTHVYSTIDCRGGPAAGSRAAFLSGFDPTAVLNAACQCTRATSCPDCSAAGLCLAERPPCDPCLSPPGTAAVYVQSRRPHRTRLVLEAEPLRALLHQRPRAFGKPQSTWTLRLAADVCWERGLTPYQVSLETIRQVLKRLGVNWRRPSGGSPAPIPSMR